MLISVILCTSNRANSLKSALKSLGALSTPAALFWELIIVDNNSSDETKAVIDDFMLTAKFPVKYVFENRQGVSWAQNTGIQETRGDIVAFTHDDCLVDPFWLTSLFQEFTADPSVSGVGGRVELYNKDDRPITIRTQREKILLTSVSQIFSLIIGCNMAFTRQVFDTIGLFDPHFGPGTKIASADDSDFLYRALKGKFKILYSPDVLVYHNHGRRTDAQVQAVMRGYLIGRGAFYCKYILRGDRDVFKLACHEIFSHTRNLVKNLCARRATERERRCLYALALGAMYELN